MIRVIRVIRGHSLSWAVQRAEHNRLRQTRTIPSGGLSVRVLRRTRCRTPRPWFEAGTDGLTFGPHRQAPTTNHTNDTNSRGTMIRVIRVIGGHSDAAQLGFLTTGIEPQKSELTASWFSHVSGFKVARDSWVWPSISVTIVSALPFHSRSKHACHYTARTGFSIGSRNGAWV